MQSHGEFDPVNMTSAWIQCASVTPDDEGALDFVESRAEMLGFTVHRFDFDGTPNLFAAGPVAVMSVSRGTRMSSLPDPQHGRPTRSVETFVTGQCTGAGPAI